MKYKDKIGKILAWLTILSSILPLFFVKSHHDCFCDECLQIFYEDKFGICVEKAIDDSCVVIAVFMYIIMVGSAMAWSEDRNALSPFVVMALVFAFVVFLALIDPSKWKFVIAISVSMAFIIGAKTYDNLKAK